MQTHSRTLQYSCHSRGYRHSPLIKYKFTANFTVSKELCKNLKNWVVVTRHTQVKSKVWNHFDGSRRKLMKY